MAKRRSDRPRAAVEALENRLLLFTYQVTGTSGSDAISLTIVGNSIISVVNGVSDSGSDILNGNIEINALGGNDTISIIKNGENNITINAGGGNDTINLSPGERNLSAFNYFGVITVNGDGNTDTVVLFDDNYTGSGNYYSTDPNEIARTDGPDVIANVESLILRGGPGESFFTIAEPTSFDLTLRGSAGDDSVCLFHGAGRTGSYLASATTLGSGSLDFNGSPIDFQNVERVIARQFPSFTFTTPNANDDLTMVSGNVVRGTSGGVPFTDLSMESMGMLTIDMGSRDGTTGNDVIALSGSQLQVSLTQINAGIGTNTLTNTGTYTIDTRIGTSLGNNLKVVNSGGTLTFDGAQFLKRLEINNGSVVRFNGTGTLLTTKELAVTSGSGTIDLATNQSGNVQVGLAGQTFSIGAGDTFIKKGLGTLSVFAAQNHGAGALLKVLAGTMNIHSDAGSPSARPLNVWAASGTLNFNATEHLNSVAADGLVSMSAGGFHVLVTNSVLVGGEGGAIDLRDNDMIVDYISPADAVAVQDLLHAGRLNGSWNGIGIASSTAAINPGHITALGSMEATDFKSIYGASITFAGQAIDNTAVLIKYTYYGDADFNGRVTDADYQRMVLGNNPDWLDGDFGDNGTVDQDDIDLIDAAFSGQGPVL